MAHLGFLLTRSPYASSGARSFYLLSKAAIGNTDEVKVFCYADGVYQCLRNQRPLAKGEECHNQWLEELVYGGADIVASHLCLESRGLTIDDLLPIIRMGTMEDLKEIVGWADRVVCL